MNISNQEDEKGLKKFATTKKVSEDPSVKPFVKEDFNEFLYPTSRQFPFDEVCEQIVRELEKRNWQVPGISVNFDEYGLGQQKFCRVSQVIGEDFNLWYCRVQRLLPGGGYNDMAAIAKIIIPKKEIHVYEDESGPTFYIYAGKNWKNDKQKFMHGIKVNSKLNGEPKSYLEYEGTCDCQATGNASFDATAFLTALTKNGLGTLRHMKHTHSRQRSPLLVHTNDLGREYDLEKGEPILFKTADVMEEFRRYLEDVVLKKIMSHPS